MNQVLKETNNQFELSINNQLMAVATYYWTKRPLIINDKVQLTNIRQIYLTDVESFKPGCGTLLIQGIINFFTELKQKSGKRPGYSRDYLWLIVKIDNLRAINLYKKCGFVIDEVHGISTTDISSPHYMMYKKL